MKVKYSAVNGVIETEVREGTSCVGDGNEIITGKQGTGEERSIHSSVENMTDNDNNSTFGGKRNGEQTTIDKCKDTEEKGNNGEEGKDTELDSVFEEDIYSQNFPQIKQRHKNCVNNKRSKAQEVLYPVKKACCCRHLSESQSETWCSLNRISKCNSTADTVDLDTLFEEPLRKRAQRACFTFVYIILAAVAVLATYSMVNDLVVSMQNPVRSVHYKVTDEYRAPGIAVYPGGANFLACGHYFNNVVTSKVRLSQLDLVKRNCSHTRLLYTDPHYPDTARDVIVFRGPTSFSKREAIFMHFALEDKTRDFFTVSYFVFDGYDSFSNKSFKEQEASILHYHTYVPTFALSAGLRMWIKLIMSETFLLDGTKHTNFDVEYSVVRFHDSRPVEEQGKHLFFIFFEWKNNLVEQSTLIYSTTPWSVLAGLCGVFLMLHRFYVLAQTSYKRVQKDKRKRTLRKETLRRIRESSTSVGTSRREMTGSEVTL